MDELLEFLGFSLGAGLATAAVRSSRGLRPVVRGVMKVALTAVEATGAAVSKAGSAAASTAADAGGEPPADENSAHKIVIARE